LSKKFTVLYALCEEQLSKQRHYDFGLRNILSILRSAGNIKRGSPGKSEEMLLMRTLRDMNLSKLVLDDVDLFLQLLKDIFPEQSAPEALDHGSMVGAIKSKIEEMELIDFHPWYMKIV
jgi:dynein heavy chain